jgi:hypothetical protein
MTDQEFICRCWSEAKAEAKLLPRHNQMQFFSGFGSSLRKSMNASSSDADKYYRYGKDFARKTVYKVLGKKANMEQRIIAWVSWSDIERVERIDITLVGTEGDIEVIDSNNKVMPFKTLDSLIDVVENHLAYSSLEDMRNGEGFDLHEAFESRVRSQEAFKA